VCVPDFSFFLFTQSTTFLFPFFVISVCPSFLGLTCPSCRHLFCDGPALGRHFKRSKSCHTKWLEDALPLDCLPTQRRRRLTVKAKCDLLRELDELEKKNIPLAQSVLRVRHPDLTPTDISRWKKLKKELFCAESHGMGKMKSLALASRVRFKTEEDTLYVMFLVRRQVSGDQTDDAWIKENMDLLLSQTKPLYWQSFQCSNGWLAGFKKRYRPLLL